MAQWNTSQGPLHRMEFFQKALARLVKCVDASLLISMRRARIYQGLLEVLAALAGSDVAGCERLHIVDAK